MATPTIVTADTTLYAPFCPDGRVYPAGSEWPGDAWSVRPGGDKLDTNALAQANKDLIEAHTENERLSANLASKDHDLAQLGKERDEAVAAYEAQKQAVLDAAKAQSDAEDVAAGLTGERDRARAETSAVQARLDAAEATIADLTAQVEALTAPKAKA